MSYLFILLGIFILMLLVVQIILFEISRSKMKRANQINWFLSLDRPYRYNRAVYMGIICFLCYVISNTENMFSMEWFLYFVLFLAMGIVADAVVQYAILFYGKKRCHKEIEEAKLLQNELIEVSLIQNDDMNYEASPCQYQEKEILQKYVYPTDHLAFLSIDNGEFASQYEPLPEATFDVEPYSDVNAVQSKLEDKGIKATKLTPAGKMPFKDEKIDTVMCQFTNYDKEEVKRVLKQGGYFLVHQNGTANFRELLEIYMPFGMKGSWDAYACAQTLESIGMRIIDKMEDYGSVRFYSLAALQNYFKKYSPDFANINKYQVFYLKALKQIKAQHYFELSTHKFLVIAQKI